MEPTIKLLNINTPVELIKSGRLIGQKCITIRFRGCNLRCAWTTPDFKGNVCKYCSTAEPGIELSIIDIMTIIKETGVKNVIISGGEAILQHDSLVELLKLLKKHKLYVIFETNATIFHYDICDKIDYLVLSPKLSTTIPTEISLRNTNIEYNENFELKHAQLRRNVKVFQAYIDSFRYKPNDYEIRVAISHSSDIFEFESKFLNHLFYVNKDNIYLVSQGDTDEQLKLTIPVAIDSSITTGYKYSPKIIC